MTVVAAVGTIALFLFAVYVLSRAGDRRDDKPTPQPEPTPTPEPPHVCVPPDGPGWEPVEGYPSMRTWDVRAAMDALGPAPGPTPEDSLDALADELAAGRGICAGRQADGLMVKRLDGLFEEMHCVSYGTGQWVATPYRGTWRHNA